MRLVLEQDSLAVAQGREGAAGLGTRRDSRVAGTGRNWWHIAEDLECGQDLEGA